MVGLVLVGSVLGLLAGAGCLVAGMAVLPALAAWSGTGVLTVLLLALASLRPRRDPLPALVPQRS